MDNLRVPQKTLNDYFELLDYQRDFLALKVACEQMQAKLAKIKIATNDPDSVDNIIDDEKSSFTTTYSSEKIEDLFSSITNNMITAKEKIVTAINAKKPSCNAKVSDTWDLLSFYIILMGNLQFNFTDTVLNKVRVSNLVKYINGDLKLNYGGMVIPYVYQPLYDSNNTVTKINNTISVSNTVTSNVSTSNLEIYLGTIRVY